MVGGWGSKPGALQQRLEEMNDEELLREYYKLREPLYIGGADAVAAANARAHLIHRECARRGLI